MSIPSIVKRSEKTFISFEAKRKDRKQNEKFLKAKLSEICSINFALVGSEKFEAKRSEKKNYFFT
jgi:hypothetical protein